MVRAFLYNQARKEVVKVKVPYNLTVNLDNPAAINQIVVKQGDETSRRLIFNIISNGKRIESSEVVFATIEAIKPDGTIVHDQITIEGAVFYYDLVEQITAVAGEVECEIELIGIGGSSISSFPIYITVQQKTYNIAKMVSENDIRSIKAYLSAAYEILKEVSQIDERFDMTYGSLEVVLKKLEDSKEDYATYMEELKVKVEEGYFNGENGSQGEKGSDAVVVEGTGIMALQIVDGNLICYYSEKEPPLEIDDAGNLIYRLEE